MPLIDRWGNPINVGYATHELLWISAANTLGVCERAQAFEQIASMTGRAVSNIRAKANSMRNEAIQNAYKGRREAAARPLLVAAGGPGPKPAHVAHWTPTKARLMGGK